jgi:hypothetical protein
MSDQPRAHWLDAWGLAALSVLLLLAQRGRPTASSVWGVGIFLCAALTVWALTSRRLTQPTLATNGSADLGDVRTAFRDRSESDAKESCPACGLTVSSSDQACNCGAPRLTDADRHQLRGPRGWLTVFRLVLLVVVPLDVAADTANGLANASHFSTGDWLRVMPEILLVAGPALYGVFVAALLAHERPEGVQHVRQYLVVSVLCFAGLVLKVGLFDGARVAVGLMPSLLGALIGAYIWTRYFRRSRRVQVTYGPGALSRKVSVRTLALVTMAVALVVFVPLATLRAVWPSAEHGWTW